MPEGARLVMMPVTCPTAPSFIKRDSGLDFIFRGFILGKFPARLCGCSVSKGWVRPYDVVIVSELLSDLVFEDCWSCGDLVGFFGFNSVFERNACDDLCEVVETAQFSPVLFGALLQLEHHVQHTISRETAV